MTIDTESGHEDELDPDHRADDLASHASQRVETMRRAVKKAQRSAAASFERTADCQDGAASTYEQVARSSAWPDDYGKHAARHREFAQEDREIAQRLRHMAQGDSAGDPA